jgi:hypothetical protein
MGDANTVPDPGVSSLAGTTAYRVVRVVPLVGYPAVWLQNGGHGKLAIGLGVILLVAAAITIMAPDKPAGPRGPPEGGFDPADSSADPLKSAA